MRQNTNRSYSQVLLTPLVTQVKIESFRFEDEDENEDQVLLLLTVRMLKSVTVTA